MKRYLCLFLMTFCCNFVQGQYVTIDGRQFKDENGNNFYPLVCNYNVNIMNLPTATDFSTSWVTPWQNYNDANSHCFDQAACNNLLISDFTEMVSLGFNALRIMNFHPIYFLKDYEIDKEHPGASDYWKCPETGFYIACGNTSSVPPVVYYNIKDKIIENHYFDLIINMFVNISQIELNNGINMKVILVS